MEVLYLYLANFWSHFEEHSLKRRKKKQRLSELIQELSNTGLMWEWQGLGQTHFPKADHMKKKKNFSCFLDGLRKFQNSAHKYTVNILLSNLLKKYI